MTCSESVVRSLDKVSLHEQSPSWTIGARLPGGDRHGAGDAGPGSTHFSTEMLTLTKYRSTPTFSFASKEFSKRKDMEAIDAQELPPRRLLSSSHSARFPGPGSYQAQPMLPLAPHWTFGATDRFLPVEKVAKESRGPGPQRYRPHSSFCSTPLSF